MLKHNRTSRRGFGAFVVATPEGPRLFAVMPTRRMGIVKGSPKMTLSDVPVIHDLGACSLPLPKPTTDNQIVSPRENLAIAFRG